MKIILTLLVLISISASAATTNRIYLTWDGSPDFDTNVDFHIYSQTNVALPLSEWKHLTNINFVTWTNAAQSDKWPGELGRVEIPAAQNWQQFYVVTASNVFGESDFSDPVYSRRLSPERRLRIGAF